jgi:8-amino-7-oxononanoate synthase
MALERYEAALAALRRRGRLRTLEPRKGVDFASNDYLALAESAYMRDAMAAALERGVPVGAGGSRLLRGNHPEHEALEAEAAGFFGAERALYFPGGFVANYALLSALPQREDLVVYDELIHASCREGLRSGSAETAAARHNDPAAFDDAIRNRSGKGRAWIVVESLYSMDGDFTPLAALMDIAERRDAMVLIDEAHATGVYGADGEGLAAKWAGQENVICLHTCGKALGAAGALICGPATVMDFMVNRSRPFIYATAPSPLTAAAVRAALAWLPRNAERRSALTELVAHANGQVERPSGSQIIPVILGDSARGVRVAQALQARGYDVRAIRPPTVPDGTARLRVSITLHADRASIDGMLAALAETLAPA